MKLKNFPVLFYCIILGSSILYANDETTASNKYINSSDIKPIVYVSSNKDKAELTKNSDDVKSAQEEATKPKKGFIVRSAESVLDTADDFQSWLSTKASNLAESIDPADVGPNIAIDNN